MADTRPRLAVNYLFMTNQGLEEHPELVVEPFNANTEQNDYEVGHLFSFPASMLTAERHATSLDIDRSLGPCVISSPTRTCLICFPKHSQICVMHSRTGSPRQPSCEISSASCSPYSGLTPSSTRTNTRRCQAPARPHLQASSNSTGSHLGSHMALPALTLLEPLRLRLVPSFRVLCSHSFWTPHFFIVLLTFCITPYTHPRIIVPHRHRAPCIASCII